ncbi:transglutaminase family protein [Parasphingorhabdus sp.]|uniref:transglutaminase family protein n=1 Tax=Parasphingorhabdus sp. TaxID=2709688 RepID=UPI003003405E
MPVAVIAAVNPADAVRVVLSTPDDKLSYQNAQYGYDKIVNPSVDVEKIESQLKLMTAEAWVVAGPNPSDIDKLKAVRQVIYDAGKWNDNIPFSYDHDDPFGLKVENKLLSTYLQTRRGNCVSMPVLHLILAERLGLNVHLSTAPLHMFIRYTNSTTGRSINIEPTSGGYPARDIWYRQKLPISDQAIERGLYLRTLTKRESIAHMAATVVQYLMDTGQYREAIRVSEAILENYPKDGFTFAKQASAAAMILERDFERKYPPGTRMPPREQVLFEHWHEINRLSYNKARSLGWEPVDIK